MRDYYVYIMSNISRTLYVGVTNNLERRVQEHKQKTVPGFTQKYNVTLLVYYESTPDVQAAIAREKQIKGWARAKKVSLIESMNPNWLDLTAAEPGQQAAASLPTRSAQPSTTVRGEQRN